MTVDSAGYCDCGAFPPEARPFARRAVEQICGSDLLAEHVAKQMKHDFPAWTVAAMRELGGKPGDVSDQDGGDYPAFVDCARLIERLICAGMRNLTARSNMRGGGLWHAPGWHSSFSAPSTEPDAHGRISQLAHYGGAL